MLRIVFQTRPTGVIEQLAERVPELGSVELDNAFYVEDGTWIESLTVTAKASFDADEIVGGVPGVSLYYADPLPTGPTATVIERLLVVANESYPFILEILLRGEAIPNRIAYRNGQFHVVAAVRDWEQFRWLADEIQQKLGQFDLASVNQVENPGEPLDTGRLSEVVVSKLSDDQLTVLETAYTMGYFEVPREATATDVAEELGIGQSTFSERLRTAERRLFELIYGSR